MSVKKYTTVLRGRPNTLNFRVYLKDEKEEKIISPFHDIPLHHESKKDEIIFNMVVEIPRWTNAKLEINKKEPLNPIIQDTKSGKLRYVNNCYPYRGYIWNYGALSQTFEDPNHIDEYTKCKGDNDPLDVCEIGARIHETGSVVQIKVLGALGLIDEGEADWKIIAIDVNDPLADKLHDLQDIEKHMPGVLSSTRDWFQIYKIPTGKPENKFALDGQFLDKKFALGLIEKRHQLWQDLFKNEDKIKDLSLTNTTLDNKIKPDIADQILEERSEAFSLLGDTIDDFTINKMNYVDRSNLTQFK